MDLKKHFGIGVKAEKAVKNTFGINDRIRASSYFIPEKLNDRVKYDITNNYLVNRNLYDFRKANINYYKEINCYRGTRHKNRYPVRGQRTHTNASKKVFKFRRFL